MNARLYAPRTFPRRAAGFVLLDAVISILIFSIGILAMVNLQGAAIKLAGDAQYRTNAAMVSDAVIAQMWGDYNISFDPTGAGLAKDYATGGLKYAAWAATLLQCAGTGGSTSCLPGTAAYPPTISVDNSGSTVLSPNSLVTVTVYWRSPNDAAPHNYVAITQISR